ncbi:MAG TPA: amidohydrolase/deacetylase family metallohydrolase [Acidimicrobiales bacterium]|nr:amidohydrolase/deacetylase family metallohydrolase [Acidimicrobiales bacterium]
MLTRLLLRGGRVIDPASGHDGKADVLIEGDRLADVDVGAPGLRAGLGAARADRPDTQVIDCSGLVVTPGLIDLHVHVYPGLGDFCLHPDQVGVGQGVPTVIDAGTSGVATFGLARKWIDDPTVRTRVLAFMDPCQIYFATKDFICHKLQIANDERNLDPKSTAAALDANSDVVIGLKVRACSTSDPHVSPFLNAAVDVAGDRPVMVHLGRFPHTPTIPTPDLLRTLRAGDVITHAFRGGSGLLGADGKVTPEFRDAVERGVRLDVGHSGTDFRFSTARALFDQGYVPTTISTDLNVFNVDHPVVSLAQTMSKMLAMGLTLTEVVAMATLAPATVIHREDELGLLAPGRSADVSVLQIQAGDVELSDGYETMTADQRLTPVGCVRGGEWIPAIPVTPGMRRPG